MLSFAGRGPWLRNDDEVVPDVEVDPCGEYERGASPPSCSQPGDEPGLTRFALSANGDWFSAGLSCIVVAFEYRGPFWASVMSGRAEDGTLPSPVGDPGASHEFGDPGTSSTGPLDHPPAPDLDTFKGAGFSTDRLLRPEFSRSRPLEAVSPSVRSRMLCSDPPRE